MDDLKAVCIDYLTTNLTPETVIDVLSIGDTLSIKELKESAIEFIKTDVSKVLKTKSWKNLNNNDLITEVMSAMNANVAQI